MDLLREDLGPRLNSAINQLTASVGQNENKVGLEAHLSMSLLILNNCNSSTLIPGKIHCAACPRKRPLFVIDSDRMSIA